MPKKRCVEFKDVIKALRRRWNKFPKMVEISPLFAKVKGKDA